jgi:hypothetical protein
MTNMRTQKSSDSKASRQSSDKWCEPALVWICNQNWIWNWGPYIIGAFIALMVLGVGLAGELLGQIFGY